MSDLLEPRLRGSGLRGSGLREPEAAESGLRRLGLPETLPAPRRERRPVGGAHRGPTRSRLTRSRLTRSRLTRSRLTRSRALETTCAAVAVVALVPRLMLVRSTLPYVAHPDEPANVGLGVRMLTDGRITPGKYNYPSLLADVVAGVGRAYEALTGPLDAGRVSRFQNAGITRTDYPDLFLGLRLVSVLVSVATCLLLALVVARTTRRTAPAAAAGLLAATSSLMVANGVLITPDVYAAGGAALALAGALAVLRSGGRWPSVLLAGAAAGLAAGAKYNAGVVLLAVVTAVLLARPAAARPPTASGVTGRILASALAAGVAFTATTPAALLEPRRVVDGVRFEIGHYGRGQLGFEGDVGPFYLRALLHGQPILLVLAVVGALVALVGPRRRELARPTLVVLAFALPYSALLVGQEVRFARNLLPLVPGLVLLAGLALSAGPRVGGRVLGWLGLAAAAVAVALVPATVADAGRSRDQPSKALARAWLQAHLPPGSRIVVESYGPFLEGYDVVGVPFVTDPGVPDDARAYVLSELGGGRFTDDPARYPGEVAAYARFRATLCLGARFAEGPWIEVLMPCGASS